MKTVRTIAFILVLVGLLGILPGYAAAADTEEAEETMLDFFKSLDYDDGLNVVTEVFDKFPVQYATTLGKNGSPQIRPIEFKFADDGVLYFDTVVFYATYSELLAHPYIQLCVCDPETMSYVRLGGKVNFTKDEDIIARCFEASETLTSQWGDKREFVIAYYLTEAWAEFQSFSSELSNRTYMLPNKFDEQKDAE